MGINIRTNLPALGAQRNLDVASNKLNNSYQRLSSGLRINRASDDAAGLAIAENLKAGSSTATVAIRNANDGISVITIADQAVSQIGNVLNRMAELATQSSNGVVDVRLAGMGLANTGESASAYSIIGNNEIDAQSAARVALDAIQVALTSINQKRGNLGALESRLEVTINNLTVARENFKAAESRIRDVDVATEAAELTRLNILQQAGASILAQANQAPQLALQLLGR